MVDNIINNGSFERNVNPDALPAPEYDGLPAIPKALTHFIRYALDQELHPQDQYVLAHADHRAMQLLLTLRQSGWSMTPGQWKELRARAPHVARIGGRESMLYRR